MPSLRPRGVLAFSKKALSYFSPPKSQITEGLKYYFKGASTGSLVHPSLMYKAFVNPDNIVVNDLVEIVSLEGTIFFGRVTFSPIGPLFDYQDIEGHIRSASASQVRFLMRSKHSDSKQDLGQLVHHSLNMVALVLPFTRAICAKLSLEKRARAVGFEYILHQTRKAAYRPYTVPPAVEILGLYLALSYYDLNYVRFSKSPFVVVPECVADSITMVTSLWSKSQLETACASFYSGENTPQTQTVLQVLHHFALYNDRRLEQAVSEIMMRAFNMKECTPLIVLKTLVSSKRLKEPFVSETLIAHQSKNRSLSDGLASNKDLNGRSLAKPYPFEKLESLPTWEKPVYSFDSGLGVSVETATGTDRYSVSLHVPLLHLPPPRTATRTSSIRAKSVSFGQGKHISLIDPSQRLEFGFHPERETTCLSVSADVRPWNNEWDPSSISLSWTKCKSVPVGTSFFSEPHSFERFPRRADADDFKCLSQVVQAWANKRPPSPCELNMTVELAKHCSVLHYMVGEWVATFACRNNLPIIYLVQDNLKPYPFINEPDATDREYLSFESGPHSKLGANSYSPVGFIFDDAIAHLNQHMISQWADVANGPLVKGRTNDPFLLETLKAHIIPNGSLANEVYKRNNAFQILRELERALETTGKHHTCFLPCTVQESSIDGRPVLSTSQELENVLVNIETSPTSVSFATDAFQSLKAQDTFVCTKILNVDPYMGTITAC